MFSRQTVLMVVLMATLISGCASAFTAQATYTVIGEAVEIHDPDRNKDSASADSIIIKFESDTQLGQKGSELRLPLYDPADEGIQVGDRIEVSCYSYADSPALQRCFFVQFLPKPVR